MERQLITKSGYDRLREELNHLKTVERPKIVTAIAEARAHGDLKENSEYHSARETQGFTEARIRDLEQKLAMAEIIDPHTLPQNGKVLFGMNTELEDCTSKEQLKYQIVSEEESDINEHKISYTSPIGRSLIGKGVGDIVAVETPGGTQMLKILKVYP